MLTKFLINAYQVFDAISYLTTRGFVHNAVGLQTVRISNRKGSVVLGKVGPIHHDQC